MTACLALLDRLAGPASSYRQAAQRKLDEKFPLAHTYTLAHVVGVVMAFRGDVEAGYTRSLQELVHADVFANFLEMASELLRNGYKDPAAVIAGSVLEEHLRKLGDKHGVSPDKPDGSPKKAETLNAELCAAEVYNKLEQKNVTAWLGLRNDAAHGHYKNYDGGQVGDPRWRSCARRPRRHHPPRPPARFRNSTGVLSDAAAEGTLAGRRHLLPESRRRTSGRLPATCLLALGRVALLGRRPSASSTPCWSERGPGWTVTASVRR